MVTQIAFIRGINVGGQKKVAMQDLARVFESLHLQEFKTYIQSGNLIFKTAGTGGKKLAKLMEDKIKSNLGFSAEVIVLTQNELGDIIRKNPFLKSKTVKLDKLHVTFLSDQPSGTAREELKTLHDPIDQFSLGEKHIYLYCPNGYGRTKLNNNFLEKKLNTPATTRNWKTVTTLFQLAEEL